MDGTVKTFKPGDKVTPTSPRSVLEYGKVYVVRTFIPPFYDGIPGTVFVQGHQYGVSAEYVWLADPEERKAREQEI